MTNFEYVLAYLGKFGLSDADVNLILFEADLSPNDDVTTPEHKIALKTAMHSQIPLMIAGLKSVSEGGYSETWDLDAIRAWYSMLAAELGLDDKLAAKQVIRDASNRW